MFQSHWAINRALREILNKYLYSMEKKFMAVAVIDDGNICRKIDLEFKAQKVSFSCIHKGETIPRNHKSSTWIVLSENDKSFLII